MTLHSSFAAAPRRRTTHLFLAAALLSLAPVVFLSGACFFTCMDCLPEPLLCTRACGSEDPADLFEVVDALECPPGTLPAKFIECVTGCGSAPVFQGCAWHCPDGTFEDPGTQSCFAECDQPPLATVCADATCPAGLMGEAACAPGGCDGAHRCVLSCHDRVIVLAGCTPCDAADPAFIELSSCPTGPDAGIEDAGPADAGPEDAGPDAG